MVTTRWAVAFLSIIVISEACSCQQSSTEETFCLSAFVSSVRVNEKEKAEKFRVYTVEHLEIFKLPESFNETALYTKIFTAPQSSTCGVKLKKGKEVVVAGEIKDGHLSIDACSTIDPAFNTSLFMNIDCSLPFPSPSPLPEIETTEISEKNS